MPSLHSTLGKNEGSAGVIVEGFTEAYRALRAIDSGAYPELRKKLREIGEGVKAQAIRNVSHNWPARPEKQSIEKGAKVSVTQTGASVYTTAPQGGVQNVGGWSHGRGPHVSRGSASHYMNRAADEKEAWVELQYAEVLVWLERVFES